MKTKMSLKMTLTLAVSLALSIAAPGTTLAAPQQIEPAVDWQQTGAQPLYQAQPAYDAQPVFSQPMASDCGCGQSACSSCAPAPAVGCGCRKAGCRSCRTLRQGCGICKRFSGCTQCPRCEEDICKLELDERTIEKTSFKTEQKSVCIPPVRLPWKKCCPPGTSKTRLVTKLKTHKYECSNCAYKWSLAEPEEPTEAKNPLAESQLPSYESTPVFDSYLPAESNQIGPVGPSSPEVYTPQVDTPPKMNPSLSKPEVPSIENVVPPPPTTGSMPWRANLPSN